MKASLVCDVRELSQTLEFAYVLNVRQPIIEKSGPSKIKLPLPIE
jgi:hypothetical protein